MIAQPLGRLWLPKWDNILFALPALGPTGKPLLPQTGSHPAVADDPCKCCQKKCSGCSYPNSVTITFSGLANTFNCSFNPPPRIVDCSVMNISLVLPLTQVSGGSGTCFWQYFNGITLDPQCVILGIGGELRVGYNSINDTYEYHASGSAGGWGGGVFGLDNPGCPVFSGYSFPVDQFQPGSQCTTGFAMI